ncbi:MAG: tetratricopeptide repeat protein [Anaerolineae bacterium]|nr:tetratricopeptide repeat protein [Anaerolineae bacterium]
MTAQTLGKYTLVRALGAGGMGSVYLAHDSLLERDVAIKVILPQLTHQPGFYERFHREARVVASLRHPHIVQVYDFAVERGDPTTEDDDRPFMVMEYLDGGSLKDRLAQLRERGESLPLAEAASILTAIAGALDYAHGRGMIHRDVKPANILFRSQNALAREPVLTDFGIARIAGEAAQPGHASLSGGLVGTPAYMSPEQASGQAVDARSDVYSLGIVLYEMVCGRVPFRADSPTAVLLQHINQAPPSPAQFNPNVPPAVQDVIARALAKQPEARFRSTGELAAALNAALAAPPAPVASDDHALDAPTVRDMQPAAPPSAPSAAPAPSTGQPTGQPQAEPKQGWLASASALAEAVSPLVGQGVPRTERLQPGRLRQLIAIIGAISVTLAAIDFAFRTLDRVSQQFSRLTALLPYLVVPALISAFVLAVFGAVRARTPTNRRLAIAAAAALGMAGIGWAGWRVYQSNLPPVGPVIVVSEFKGCTGCPDRIFDDDIYNELLKQSAALNFPIEVQRVRESDHPIVGDALAARQLGRDRKASLVIWGTYDANNVSPQFELLAGSQGAAPLLGADDLRSFSYNLDANTRKIEHVAFLALGVMRYIEGDYENALSLFERAVNSLSAEQTEVRAEAAYFYRAAARLRTGKPIADVVSDLEKARNYDPKSAAIRHNLSVAYISACKPDGTPALDWALQENTYVIDSGRSDAVPFEVRGWIHELMGDWDEAADAYEEALNRGSADPDVRTSLVRALTTLGRTDDAATVAQAASSASPMTVTTPLSVALATADADWYAGRFDAAALGYRQALTEARALDRPAEELSRLQAYVGMAQMRAGRWQDAVASLEASLKQAPRYFGLRSKTLDSPYVLLGISYHALGQYDKAVENFERALQIYPCDANTLVQLGNTLLEQKRYDDALAALDRAAIADPNNASVDLIRGLALEAMQRPATEVVAAYQAAVKKYEALVKREPGNAAAREQLARAQALLRSDAGPVRGLLEVALEALGRLDYAAALAPLQQAAELSPENALAHRLLGMALRGVGQADEALAALRTAQTLAPDDPQVYYELGMTYAQRNQTADAIAALRRGVELKPDDSASWLLLANMLWRDGQLAEAQAASRRAVELRPDDPLAHGLLGMVLVASQQYTAAVPSLQQAVTLSPTYGLALQFLGNAHYRLGQLDEAVSAIRRARDADPTNADVQASYAFALAEQGRADEAFAEAQKALALGADPNNPLLQYALGIGYKAQGKAAEAKAAFEAVANNADAEPALREKARRLIE